MNSIKVGAGIITLRSDGIMQMEIGDDCVVDIKDLKEIGDAVFRIGNGKKFPNLILVGEYSNITKDARDYSTTIENNVYTLADAFVVRAMHQKLLANLYLKINQPKIPTRFFESEEDAVDWLKKYL